MSTEEGKRKKKAGPPKNSVRAGLQFPVGRLHRFMKERRWGKRISPRAAVYMAAVLEYLNAEVLELAGNQAREGKKKRIIPRHVAIGIREDEELLPLVGGDIVIPGGGVAPSFVGTVGEERGRKKKSTGGRGGGGGKGGGGKGGSGKGGGGKSGRSTNGKKRGGRSRSRSRSRGSQKGGGRSSGSGGRGGGGKRKSNGGGRRRKSSSRRTS